MRNDESKVRAATGALDSPPDPPRPEGRVRIAGRCAGGDDEVERRFDVLAGSFGAAFQAAFDLVRLIGKDVSSQQDGLKALEGRLSRIEEIQGAGLLALAGQLDNIKALLSPLGALENSAQKRLAGIEFQLAQIANAQGVQAHNLEQLRLLGEAAARKAESTTDEFIQRQVKDPLLLDLHQLSESLRAALSDGHGDLGKELRAALAEAERRLEAREAAAIRPNVGDAFHPKHHQPIQRVETSDPALHGRIARVCQNGLIAAGRVVSPARVAVYAVSPTRACSV